MLRVTKSMIKDVVSEVAGEDCVQIILDIGNRVNVSEFIISDELSIDIRELRRKLYKLWEAGLVRFKRKKDKKRGWYIYYWTFIPSRVWFLFRDLRVRKLQKLKERLEQEENNEFYLCPNGCVRLDFSQAVEFDFKCPECGSLLVPNDNSRTISHLKDEIAKLTKEIEAFDKREREFEKSQKAKIKKEKEKIEREEKEKERKLKEKEEKKAMKKKAKKAKEKKANNTKVKKVKSKKNIKKSIRPKDNKKKGKSKGRVKKTTSKKKSTKKKSKKKN